MMWYGNSIIGLRKSLLRLNINLDSVFVRKVGNGASVRFWEETWYGNAPFKDVYPRLYALESSKSCNINERCNNSLGPLTRSWAWRRPPRSGIEMEQLLSLTNLLLTFDITSCPDSWICSTENNKHYRVSAMRKVIEGCILESGVDTIRWNNSIPIKINIHSWRLSNNRLPTRINLDARGIDLHSVRCPICDEDVETPQHLFIDCIVASRLWSMVANFWRIDDYLKDLPNLITWGDTANLLQPLKACFDAVIQTTLWVIWRFRNRICFDAKPPRKDTLVDEIKNLSHLWIKHRNRNFNPNLIEWTVDPKNACNVVL
nr:reverse transcriptase domain, reverse transcriptase zinc-binding domain protein [Tanacetum cinerariifolium]